LEGGPIYTQILIDRDIPRLAKVRVGVPTINENTIDIKEDFHRSAASISSRIFQRPTIR
jgi:hypothetical protein